jgi:PAS domain S-box-containing protein
MERTFDRWLVGAGGLVALLVVAGVLTFQNTRLLNYDAEQVAHTHEVMTDLENLLSLAKDAETGQRGYLITGEPRYLEPFNTAIAGINKQVDDVERLTADNPQQQARIPELREHISAQLKELELTIALRKNGDFDAARQEVLTDRGKKEMDALRVIIREMLQHEEDLLRERSEKRQRTYHTALLTGLVSGVAAVVGVVAFMALLRRHLAARTVAAAEIAEKGERLRTTLASIGDAVLTTDIEGRITNMNGVAESLTGWTCGEAIGQPLEVVFRIVNEKTRQSVESPATRSLREGIIVGLANHTVLLAKDGTERPIDDSAAPIRCQQGKVMGCVLVFRDVTQRRRLEKENADRLAAARFLASIVESSGDAIVSKSLDGIIQSWNAAAHLLFGYAAEQAVGKHISLIIPPDRADEEEYINSRIRAGERVEHFETVRLRSDGQPIHISLTISAIEDEAGHVVGASKIARDITDRKQAEERIYSLLAELKGADRRKDEFLATLAHELRGPLAPIRNMLEIMKRADDNGDLLQQARSTMERQLGQLVRLVDDLIDVSRITRNKIELRKEHVELASVLHQSVEACRPLAECANHQMSVTLPPEPIYLHGDPVRLAQVFSNILHNACKYTDPGGKIWLTAERQGSDVVVKVKDTGLGIPPDKLASVFEMFTQIDRTVERSQGGLGIGLTLVKRLVEMHDGTVTAHSEGPGKGSEFVVRLPILIEQPKHDTPKPAAVTTAPLRRILIVDDNTDTASSLAMLLNLTGNETQTAHDGLQAVEAAEKFRPDVVLLDIGLPKLNGLDACRRIREQPWGKDMVMVAMTGWGQDEDRRKSKDAGFDSHMVKPVDYTALMNLLAESQKSPVR